MATTLLVTIADIPAPLVRFSVTALPCPYWRDTNFRFLPLGGYRLNADDGLILCSVNRPFGRDCCYLIRGNAFNGSVQELAMIDSNPRPLLSPEGAVAGCRAQKEGGTSRATEAPEWIVRWSEGQVVNIPRKSLALGYRPFAFVNSHASHQPTLLLASTTLVHSASPLLMMTENCSAQCVPWSPLLFERPTSPYQPHAIDRTGTFVVCRGIDSPETFFCSPKGTRVLKKELSAAGITTGALAYGSIPGRFECREPVIGNVEDATLEILPTPNWCGSASVSGVTPDGHAIGLCNPERYDAQSQLGLFWAKLPDGRYSLPVAMKTDRAEKIFRPHSLQADGYFLGEIYNSELGLIPVLGQINSP